MFLLCPAGIYPDKKCTAGVPSYATALVAALEGDSSLWCPVKASTAPGAGGPGYSSEEKCSMSSVISMNSHTDTTTEVYGGSVTLTCQGGEGRVK